ncbi:hypothetical protein [Inhella crocodyli]|uniref:Uncharacterized protein n=1 Tax=Inhella crocodyli TaxID=2499851 RepID=A0A3S2V476_9BURK|nr:hypothetical protein [Inhella crocodyli]RVT87872.1 hypothetical protein EOD73_02310 [Inhella crocodyli]
MVRFLFLVAWVAGMGLMAAAWTAWKDLADVAFKPTELPILTVVMAVSPWIAGPGLLPWLRRMESGGINMPNADYWFSGERRAESLRRMGPYLDAMGLLVLALLAGMVALDLWHARQGQKVSDLISLSLVALFLIATALWLMALMRAFPKPPADPAAALGAHQAPRRPRRPGEPH